MTLEDNNASHVSPASRQNLLQARYAQTVAKLQSKYNDPNTWPAPYRTFLRAILELATAEVRTEHKDYISPLHIFMILTLLKGGCTQDALHHLGHDPEQVYRMLHPALGTGKADAETPILPTRSCKDVLLQSEELATVIDGEKFINEQAIAQAILSLKVGVTHDLLVHRGIDPNQLLEAIKASHAQATLESAALAHENLETLDLTTFLTPSEGASNS
jgi:ATP-dependent Clp protease ATP-binding subunit ClpA